MKLHLTSSTDNRLIRILRAYAHQMRADDVELTSEPARADVIVLADPVDWHDPYFARARRHPLLLRHPDKFVLYNEADVSRARLPALAVNALDVPWQMGIGSPPVHEDDRPLERMLAEPTELMGFVGSRSSPVRHEILDAYASRHRTVIDTDAFDAWHATPDERTEQRRIFEASLADALFALCPRGAGTTSLRLYEAMQAGRCPVILADRWVEDYGVDWSFALRVRESDHDRLEEILRAVPRQDALERGAEGRRQWEATYAPTRYVRTLARAAAAMLERRVVVPSRSVREFLEDDARTFHLRARTLKTWVANAPRRRRASMHRPRPGRAVVDP